MTNEGINGDRRPFQIVIATDRQLPLGDIVDSIILSTEGTGLLQGDSMEPFGQFSFDAKRRKFNQDTGAK